jgi:hypothetical protein
MRSGIYWLIVQLLAVAGGIVAAMWIYDVVSR